MIGDLKDLEFLSRTKGNGYEKDLVRNIVGLSGHGLYGGIPNLVGNWTGTENAYLAEDGSYKLSENTSVSYVITEQSPSFYGKCNTSAEWGGNG